MPFNTPHLGMRADNCCKQTVALKTPPQRAMNVISHYVQNPRPRPDLGVQSLPFPNCKWKEGEGMNWRSRLILGVVTALAMMLGTYLLPRGGALRDASLVQFPTTVGVWAIFVLLFVRLK
jgi:hypothetical protein